MAIKTSGSLALSEIASEFQDGTPHSLSEFYRGGSLVPDASANSNVPSSGAISIGNFYGSVRQFATGYSSTYVSGGYRYLIFTSSGTLSCAAIVADYVVIGAGGAGGGGAWGGGGGGGRFLTGSAALDGNYPITIGAPGGGLGQVGGTTTFNGITSIGGGYGGWDVTLSSVAAPIDGYASGGGGAGSKYYPGTSQEGGLGIQSNGGNGYSGGSGVDAGGGGGGAGGSGGHASSHYGGVGGPGLQWLDGNYYCGGGGGYGNGGWQRESGIGYNNYGGGAPATGSAQQGAVIIRYPI